MRQLLILCSLSLTGCGMFGDTYTAVSVSNIIGCSYNSQQRVLSIGFNADLSEMGPGRRSVAKFTATVTKGAVTIGGIARPVGYFESIPDAINYTLDIPGVEQGEYEVIDKKSGKSLSQCIAK